MKYNDINGLSIDVDFEKGQIEHLYLKGIDRIAEKRPLFRIGVRKKDGTPYEVSAYDAKKHSFEDPCFVFEGFGENSLTANLIVKVSLVCIGGCLRWRISADPQSKDVFIEYADFPLAALPKLSENNENGDGGSVLFPYNEGVLVSDYRMRETTAFTHWPLVYPSYGSLAMFPNMVSSQMMAYLFDDAGIYFGAHDSGRALKGIDYFDTGNAIEMRFRLFSGCSEGEVFSTDYDIVWAACESDWQSAAAIYRDFFEANLPPRAKKTTENENLPDWYADEPLVVSYPVRGTHDMDIMEPNAFFPYINALPTLDDIAEKTGSKLLVLLMHWEGTAPWAPPYVWPPYGGEKPFSEFVEELRKRGMLIGVYCSGFGYTLKSNVVDNYSCEDEFKELNLIDSMCAGPDQKVLLSNICPGQRSGYDICPATETGNAILDKAYTPLFKSGIDYAQILDQNHGGGQYLCYSKTHGHPSAPGLWMTENMQKLLTSWNEKAGRMILGCESAASEPFIGNLLLSDNRYELNYFIGRPVPLYSFIYHEYVRNFMGNQVCCPLESDEDTFCYRLGYSFAAGDLMTIVLTPEGGIMSDWGTRDFTKLPDKAHVLSFIKNLTAFYRESGKKFLNGGRMIRFTGIRHGSTTLRSRYITKENAFPEVISTAWEAKDAEKAVIAVNPGKNDAQIEVNDVKYTVPAIGVRLIKI